MDELQARLFDQLTGTVCAGCEWLQVCGAANAEHACRSVTRTVAECGPGALHPRDAATNRYMRSVNGPGFDTITAAAAAIPALPGYLPQLRTRSALSGTLDEGIYAVRGDVAIGRRSRVLGAGELRAQVGLSSTQKLVLVLFCQDTVLERLWDESPAIIREIAAAGYDLVVAPSFSVWTPRPRTEHLYNLKRSLVIYGALQRLGVPAAPRVGWVNEQDVRRLADWLTENACVQLVALDCATYRSTADWQGQLDGLESLERLTGRRLRYLVNGPTTSARYADVFSIVPAGRVCMTSATLAPPPPPPDRQLALPAGRASRSGFQRRCSAQRTVIAEGQRMARTHHPTMHAAGQTSTVRPEKTGTQRPQPHRPPGRI